MAAQIHSIAQCQTQDGTCHQTKFLQRSTWIAFKRNQSRDGRNIKPAHTIDDSNAALEMGWKYEL
jgi:hypothetical protein